MTDERKPAPDGKTIADGDTQLDTVLSPRGAGGGPGSGDTQTVKAPRGAFAVTVSGEDQERSVNRRSATGSDTALGDDKADESKSSQVPASPGTDSKFGGKSYRSGPRIYGSAPTQDPTQRFKVPDPPAPPSFKGSKPRRAPAKALGAGTAKPDDDCPPFPWSAFGDLFSELFAFVWARGWGFRIAVIFLLLSPVAAAAGWWQWVEYKKTHFAQVLGKEKLLAGPKANTKAYPAVGFLRAAERVKVLEELESYALVRDAQGRVGYLPRAKLTWRPLTVRPDTPFVGCAKSPVASNASRCEKRGRRQMAACLDFCSDLAEPSECQTACERRLTACVKGCTEVVSEKARVK